MKCHLTDHGMGVMLILRGPGGFAGGRVVDALVSQIDLFPTICELVGAAPPEWLEGRSLMPLARGEAEEINDEVFGEVNYHAPTSRSGPCARGAGSTSAAFSIARPRCSPTATRVPARRT